MALNRLANTEMLKLGEDLVRPKGKQRIAMEGIPSVRGLIPTLERANEALIVAQVPGDTEAAALTEQLKAKDERHDDLVRAIDGRLEAEYRATVEPELRDRITRLRGRLFASGREVIQRSYMETAGEVSLRAARVTDDDKKLLHELETLEGHSVEALFDELQACGRQIGVLEKRRQELGDDGEVVVKNRAARFQWIRAVNAIAAVLESEAIDAAPILGPIREAEANAERRGAAAADDGVDATDPGADNGDATDIEVDPSTPPVDPDAAT